MGEGVKIMTSLMELYEKLRFCYICGRKMDWGNFFANGLRKDGFNLEMLEEIWRNPIFILECCWCFNGISGPPHC